MVFCCGYRERRQDESGRRDLLHKCWRVLAGHCEHGGGEDCAEQCVFFQRIVCKDLMGFRLGADELQHTGVLLQHR